MNTCRSCGSHFYPQSPAWGDDTCGDCIADRIEYGLLGGVLRTERKPVKRAGVAAAGDDVAVEFKLETAQRRA